MNSIDLCWLLLSTEFLATFHIATPFLTSDVYFREVTPPPPHLNSIFTHGFKTEDAFKVLSSSCRSHPPLQFPSGLWTWGSYRDLKHGRQWRHFFLWFLSFSSQLLPALGLQRASFLTRLSFTTCFLTLPPESRSWPSWCILGQRGARLLIDVFTPTHLFIFFPDVRGVRILGKRWEEAQWGLSPSSAIFPLHLRMLDYSSRFSLLTIPGFLKNVERWPW